MSSIIAVVKEIQNCDSLNIVKFEFNNQVLSMMSLDLNEDIKVGTKVKLLAKSSHIAIGKNYSGEISYSNQLQVTIDSIENGKLLSSINLKYFDTILESIITISSSKKMNLKVGDNVIAFIKASELSISEILND
ncbi:MAG: TOBE domain-containing protein [Campylobacterota bacterium]|nr:TOBE domain-containing protein [Campylobacterota bacterium]